MTKSMLTRLQEMTQGVSEKGTAEDKVLALKHAFELFSKETGRLEGAYSALKEQFRSVNVKLEETNRALNAKVSELDNTTNYLHSILGHMSQGILFIALSGHVTTCNAAAETILGLDATKVLFHAFWDNFPDTKFSFSMQEALSSGKAPDTAYATIETDQGMSRELEVSTSFVLKGNKSTQGLIVLFRDITEVRHLQVIANRNDRMKELGEMAASVAHEIRNPLGGIKGFAALLHRDLEDRPQQQQLAAHIVEGSKALDRLITQVLNYSRPLHMQFVTTDLVPYVRSVAEFAIADKGLGENIELMVQSTLESLSVAMDPDMIRCVLLNLLVNAAQAMPQGGTVTLSLHHKKGRAVIRVNDTGHGIPEENLEKIFSPFFTTKVEGNGLGLADAHKIVQAHGGTIEVESEVGKGSTFSVVLPIVQ